MLRRRGRIRCETEEATVLCCADEAALCGRCDQTVHAANKLASKHQRVSLSNSTSSLPICDICQDAAGYFFCLEDRALLCRKCDISIHSANSLVSSHQRFLLTGVRVGFEPAEPCSSSSGGKTQSEDFHQNYNFTSHGSTKADSGKLGSSDSSTILRSLEDDLDSDNRLGQVPDISWSMPQSSSPPTSSGIYWPRSCQELADSTLFVPDISWSQPPTYHHFHHQKHDAAKRRRQL